MCCLQIIYLPEVNRPSSSVLASNPTAVATESSVYQALCPPSESDLLIEDVICDRLNDDHRTLLSALEVTSTR